MISGTMKKFNRSRGDDEGGETFEERFKARRGKFSRDSPRRGDRMGGGRDFQRTRVICASCGKSCEVPFKPTSNKPVYCENCFGKSEKGSDRGSSRSRFSRDRDSPSSSSVNLDEVNEKLDKIMKALKIKY